MLEILSLLSPGAVAPLFAFLVSRCQRGRESRGFVSLPSCECVFVACSLCLSRKLFSRHLLCFGLCLWDLVPVHMVWDICYIIPYYLCLSSTLVICELHAYPVIYLAHTYPSTFKLCFFTCRLSCWTTKYRGSVDPNVCALHSKGTSN